MTEAEHFIEDYGVDGERLYAPYEECSNYISQGVYRTRKSVRLFCKDCADFNYCRGRKWDNCEYRKEFQKIVDKELVSKIRKMKEL